MVSPELQATAIRDYCLAKGYQLVDVVEGLDQSGSSRRSAWWPTLDRAVDAVEAGEYDGLVVWKFSRTARHRLKWAVALDRVETAGGVLESATEQFDTTTSAGRFARGMVAEMNAFEAERIGEGWRETHARRVADGLPATGKPKWGYAYDRDAKMHRPHPEQGPALAAMYRRYVAGESVYSLVRWLNAHGHRTLAGGDWTQTTLRRVLDSGFAAGFFRYQGELREGRHEPLITRDEWQAYLDARAERAHVPSRVTRSSYVLSGMVRCARCGRPMVANRVSPGMKLSRRAKGRAEGKRYSNGAPRLTFRCERGQEAGVCPGGSVGMAVAEAAVLAYLEERAAGIDQRAVEHGVGAARRTLLEVEEQRAASELTKVEQALVRLAMRDAESPMPPAIYEQARGELEKRRLELLAVAESAGREARRMSADPAGDAASLLQKWDVLPVESRREVLRTMIDCVIARGGDGVVRIVERGEVRP